jgi:hypothetical protein
MSQRAHIFSHLPRFNRPKGKPDVWQQAAQLAAQSDEERAIALKREDDLADIDEVTSGDAIDDGPEDWSTTP